jgi:hypothetical protein
MGEIDKSRCTSSGVSDENYWNVEASAETCRFAAVSAALLVLEKLFSQKNRSDLLDRGCFSRLFF